MRIDVVVNTTANRLRTRPRLLDRMRRAAGSAAAIHPTRSLAELTAVADTIAARGTDLVVLAGGDGPRVTNGAAATFAELDLVHLATEDGFVYGRWVRRDITSAPPS